MNFSKEIRTLIAITPTEGAAGTSDINGATLDMVNARGVQITVVMGAITATAVTSIKVQESADGSTWADLAGTAQTIADTDDEKVFYIDLYRPLKRYARVVVDRGTANAVVAAALYQVYENEKLPVTQGTNVSGEQHISPIAGTA